MNPNQKLLPPLRDDQLGDEARKAVRAARRVADNLRDQKRLLGQKLVIFQDGKVVKVDP